MRIAILASGSGTNAQAIIDRVKHGSLGVEIACIISNNPAAHVLQRAADAGIATRVFAKQNYASRLELDEAIVEFLQQDGCDLVVLAGYMLIVGNCFIEAFRNRILNIHPSLLPAFPGTAGIAGAYDYGVRLTGVSVHFVVEEVDAGPIIIQAATPVKTEESLDSLEQRIHAIEHRIYPQAIQWYVEGRLEIEGRKVKLAPANRALAVPEPSSLIWPPLEKGF